MLMTAAAAPLKLPPPYTCLSCTVWLCYYYSLELSQQSEEQLALPLMKADLRNHCSMFESGPDVISMIGLFATLWVYINHECNIKQLLVLELLTSHFWWGRTLYIKHSSLIPILHIAAHCRCFISGAKKSCQNVKGSWKYNHESASLLVDFRAAAFCTLKSIY